MAGKNESALEELREAINSVSNLKDASIHLKRSPGYLSQFISQGRPAFFPLSDAILLGEHLIDRGFKSPHKKVSLINWLVHTLCSDHDKDAYKALKKVIHEEIEAASESFSLHENNFQGWQCHFAGTVKGHELLDHALDGTSPMMSLCPSGAGRQACLQIGRAAGDVTLPESALVVVSMTDAPMPGDLVFYRSTDKEPGHIGVYSDARSIRSPKSKRARSVFKIQSICLT